jgi:hypothetical protein
MGTAIGSFDTGIGSREERDALKELLALLEKPANAKKRAALDQVFRKVINEALSDKTDKNTRENIARAIQSPVMEKVTSKYLKWKANKADGKKPKWPFPDKPKKRRKRVS